MRFRFKDSISTRLFRYTLYLGLIPACSGIFILAFRDDPALSDAFLLLSLVLQTAVLLLCRRAMRPLIRPDAAVLTGMNMDYIPTAYEPGRYRTDARAASVVMWLALLAPVFARLAARFPETVTFDSLGGIGYTAPDIDLLLVSLLFLIFGTAAFPFWAETARCAVLYAEGSDRRRYLLRGFAEYLDERGAVGTYLAACKEQKAAQKAAGGPSR